MGLNRVVVSEMGALTPIGNSLSEYWSGLRLGKSGAAPISNFDAEFFKTKFACELKNLHLSDYIDKRELRKMDPYTAYALIAAEEAIKHSCINLETLDKKSAGVIWGSGIGGIKTFSDEVEYFVKNNKKPRFNPAHCC